MSNFLGIDLKPGTQTAASDPSSLFGVARSSTGPDSSPAQGTQGIRDFWLGVAASSNSNTTTILKNPTRDAWMDMISGGDGQQSSSLDEAQQLAQNKQKIFGAPIGAGLYPIAPEFITPLQNVLRSSGSTQLLAAAEDGLANEAEKEAILSKLDSYVTAQTKEASASRLGGTAAWGDALSSLDSILPTLGDTGRRGPGGDAQRAAATVNLADFLKTNDYSALADALRGGSVTHDQHQQIKQALQELQAGGITLPVGVASQSIDHAKALKSAEWSSETSAPGEKQYTFRTDSPEGRALRQWIDNYTERDNDFISNAGGTLDEALLNKIRNGEPMSREDYKRAWDSIANNLDDHQDCDYVLGQTKDGDDIEVLGDAKDQAGNIEGRLVEVNEEMFWIKGDFPVDGEGKYDKNLMTKIDIPDFGNDDLTYPTVAGLSEQKTKAQLFGEVVISDKHADTLLQFLKSLPTGVGDSAWLEAVENGKLSKLQRDEIQSVINDWADKPYLGA